MRNRKIISLLISLLLIFSVSVPVFAINDSNNIQNETFEGELIVSILDDTNYISAKEISSFNQTIDDVISSKGFTIKDSLLESTGIVNDEVGSYDSDSFKSEVIEKMGYVYLVNYPDQKLSFKQAKSQLEKVLKNSGYTVKSIEPNYVVSAIATTETIENIEEQNVSVQAVHPSQKWQYDMIKAPAAWQTTTGSSQVKVAVLDTGIDGNHTCLKNYIDTQLARNYTGGSTTDTTDRQGHGTHVAGTIASYGSVSGVMQVASLVPIKVLGDDGRGSTYGIMQGILYVADNNIDVINMSLGGGSYSSQFESACQTAVSKGVIIVAASGNEYKSTISYPAAYESVIAVGAVDSNRRRAGFSNYGAGLAVMAPGVSVYSTSPGSLFKSMNGTSMASPHVAGVAGLMRSANKNVSVAQVTSVLKSTAQNAGSALEYGSGIVDADAAVKAVSGTTPVDKVSAPTFNPASGTYKTAQNVTISCATAGATIRYTTDGSEPTANSQVYNGAINVSKNATIKAKAFKSGMTDSITATASYIIDTGTVAPNAWKAYTFYKVGDIVSFDNKNYECRLAHTAYPGWEPANVPALWRLYSGTVTPIDTVVAPTFNPAGGTYKTAQNVTISCATAGATIRYTTDGSEPTANSPVYSGAINVTKNATLKAKAFKSGMTDSAIITSSYIIDDGAIVEPNAWKAYTPYKQGDIVTYNNKTFECRQPHTSLPGWEPANVPALWTAK